MAKGMSQMGNWVEVAPAPFIKPRRHSTSPKLDTIFEEASYYGESGNEVKTSAVEVHVPKRVAYLLPVVIAMASYYLLLLDISA